MDLRGYENAGERLYSDWCEILFVNRTKPGDVRREDESPPPVAWAYLPSDQQAAWKVMAEQIRSGEISGLAEAALKQLDAPGAPGC